MNKIFDICCGEVEEEYKPTAFEDDGFGNDDDDAADADALQQSNHVAALQKTQFAVALRRHERVTIWSRPINVKSLNFEPRNHFKTQEQALFLETALRKHFLFEELRPNELQILIHAMQREEIPMGTTIVKQDETEQQFYIVESGTLDLYSEVGQKSVGTLQPGDFLGTMALLYPCKRNQSAMVIQGDAVIWKVDQETFRHVLAQHSYEQHLDLQSRLKQIQLFAGLDDATLTKFATAFSHVQFEPNDRIVQKGEIGDIFYIIEEGSAKVHEIGLGDGSSVDQILVQGDFFGEGALLTGEPRTAHVTAITKVKALAMNRETFEKSMGPLKDIMEQHEKVRALKSIPIFANSTLELAELRRLAQLTQEMSYHKGQKLAEAGQPYQPKVWIIRQGRLLVTGGPMGHIYNLQSGDYFGDKLILNDDATHKSTHDVVCEENLTCWVLDKLAIESVVGDIHRLGASAGFHKVPHTHNPTLGSAEKRLRLRDLNKLRILGVGGFGRVWLTETKETHAHYALKIINKRRLLDSQQQESVSREKELLSLLDHPFILNLVSSFQDERNLYLVLPLIQGGELFNVVSSHAIKNGGRRGLQNKDAAFYAGCIIDALGHFHHRHIAYRDMKLENVMIDSEGYGKLVDLGFAKVVIDKTYTFVGTPDYLAPEIIMSRGYNHAVDYWSFGVLLFELLTGKSPFHSNDQTQTQMFKRIVMVDYAFPPDTTVVCEEAQDLIRSLLVRAQTHRLGNLHQGHEDVKLHPWFTKSDCDFPKLLKRQLPAPWIPPIKNAWDSQNFDDYSSLEKEGSDLVETKPLSKEEQDYFKAF
jgi:serine/threonine protein kinase